MDREHRRTGSQQGHDVHRTVQHIKACRERWQQRLLPQDAHRWPGGRQPGVVEAHVGRITESSPSGVVEENGVPVACVTPLQGADHLLREAGDACLPVAGAESHDLAVDADGQHDRPSESAGWPHQPAAAALPR